MTCAQTVKKMLYCIYQLSKCRCITTPRNNQPPPRSTIVHTNKALFRK